MTAHAVGSPSAIPTSIQGTPNTAAAGSTGAFEHQLQAAQERGPARQERSQQGPDSSHDRHNDTSPGRSSAGTGRLDKNTNRPSEKGKAAPAEASKPQATVKAPAPPMPSTATPPVAGTPAVAVSGEVAPAEHDAGGSEQDASALVGVMLALIGPAANKVLVPGTAGGPGSPGNAVPADTGPAVLLQAGDAAAVALTTNMASTAVPAQLLAANGLMPDPRSARDPARVELAPAPMLSAPAPAAPGAPISVPISAPPGGPGFAQELAQQVTWLVGQDTKQARIRLHPEELGSLDLKISVNHGRVDVVFHAQHPGAVTAVQQSLPQLDQMLSQHGLSLGNSEVGQHDRGDQSGHGGRGDRASGIDEAHDVILVTPASQVGLLDAFA